MQAPGYDQETVAGRPQFVLDTNIVIYVASPNISIRDI